MEKLPSVMKFKKQWLEDWFYGVDCVLFQSWLLVSLLVNKKSVWVVSTLVFALVSFGYYWGLVRYIRSFKLAVKEDGSFVVQWRIGFRRIASIRQIRGYRAKHRFLWLQASVRVGFWFGGRVYGFHEKQKIVIPLVYKKRVWDLFLTRYQCEKARRQLEEAMLREKEERRCS